jgi:AraC-like DNA-binding protein
MISSGVTLRAPLGSDPVRCDELAFGIGAPGGMLVLRYLPGGALSFGHCREDFLHQLFWSPDSVLISARDGHESHVGGDEALWVHRATSHDIRAFGHSPVFRICLREEPPGLHRLRYGAVTVPEEVRTALVTAETTDDVRVARERLFATLRATPPDTAPTGRGHAATVAHHLSYDPGDPSSLEQWASRLHISSKTLQRDFVMTFGMPFSQWRTTTRLELARALVQHEPVAAVSARVGYRSTSAFIAAYRREFGHTPGRHHAS